MLPNEKEQLETGTWELDCVKMNLRRKDGAQEFSGSGFIRQNSDRQLEFKLLDSASHLGARRLKGEFSGSTAALGDLHPDGNFFVLTAIDKSGQEWISERTIRVKRNYGSAGAVVIGTISKLSNRNDASDAMAELARRTGKAKRQMYPKYSLKCRFFGEYRKFPFDVVRTTESKVGDELVEQHFSMSVSKHEADGYTFQLTQGPGWLELEASSENGSPEANSNLAFRCVEALQFVLGHPVQWTILETFYHNVTETQIASRRTDPASGRIPPPIQLERPPTHCWQLFSAYFRHVCNHNDASWHPLSRRIFSFQQAGSAIWPILLLVSTVEIEGIVKDEFDLSSPVDDEAEEAVDDLGAYLDARVSEGALSERLAQRLRGKIKTLTNEANARQILKQLAEQGRVSSKSVKAWTDLRNKAAHAVSAEINDKNNRRYLRVTMLLYELVFALVGYEGPYPDYGERDFPTKRYKNGKVCDGSSESPAETQPLLASCELSGTTDGVDA